MNRRGLASRIAVLLWPPLIGAHSPASPAAQDYPVRPVRIGYKGAGPALNDVIANQVQVMFPTAGAGMPHMKAGRVRALAVTSAEPSAVVPQLPTVASSGLPGYESLAIYGVFAPAKTPAPLIDRVNREIVRVLAAAEVRERFLALGMETRGGTPAQLGATITSEMARMTRVIRAAGIRASQQEAARKRGDD